MSERFKRGERTGVPQHGSKIRIEHTTYGQGCIEGAGGAVKGGGGVCVWGALGVRAQVIIEGVGPFLLMQKRMRAC